MAEGQGNITYGSRINAGGGGGIVVTGARNGLSVDPEGYIILGQSIGAGGNPAALLSDEEIPMAGFYLNLFDGQLVVSANREPAVGSGLLQVIRNGLGESADMLSLQLINNTPATNASNQYSPSILLQGQSWDSSDMVSRSSAWGLYNMTTDGSGDSGGGLVIAYSDSGGPLTLIAELNNFGQFTVPFVDAPDGFLTNGSYSFEPVLGVTFDLSVDQSGVGEGSLYLMNTSGGGLIPTAYSAANLDDTINREYFKLGWNNTPNMLVLSVEAQGTGVIRPVAFLPSIRFGDNTPPTASIDITPGTAAIGPLRLHPGTLVTTPVDGLFEYDGTNLYFTVGATRKTVTLI
jgi:hypothetical protein